MYQKTSIKKKTLGQQTEDRLMEYILNQPIATGEKIPNEFLLAEQFGVGRGTVREAVKGLVSRGVLEVRRGDGTYVVSTGHGSDDLLGLGETKDSYQLALDLFEVRLLLEPEAAAWACEHAQPEQIQKAEELCMQVERLYQQGIEHVYKDIEFHSYLARISGNQVMEKLLPVINRAVVTFANMTYRSLKDETLSTHRAIVEALKKRDAIGARGAMTMHLTYNRQAILEMIEERNENQENTSDVSKKKYNI